MNGQIAAGISAEEDSVDVQTLNPFVHHLELETTWEKIKVGLALPCPVTHKHLTSHFGVTLTFFLQILLQF